MKASIRDLQTPEMVKPFAVEFQVRTKDELMTLYHVVNMSRAGLARTIDSNSVVPLPTKWFMYVNANATDKCIAEIDRLKLRSNVTHDGRDAAEVEDKVGVNEEDAVGDLEWLKWEGKFMKPGMYQVRGTGYSCNDYFITLTKNSDVVVPSWTDTQYSLLSFSSNVSGCELEYKIILQF